MLRVLVKVVACYADKAVVVTQVCETGTILVTQFIRHWQRPVQRSDWFPLTIHSHMIHIYSISSLSWVQTRPSWTTSSWLVASLVNCTTEAPFTW